LRRLKGLIEMRIVAGVLLAFAATMSTASAQSSFAMDHGHAADAAAASKAASVAASNKAAAIAAGTPPTSSQNTDFKINGDGIIRTTPARIPEQDKTDAVARTTWQLRCRPTTIEDREGIRRTQYAEPDCDLSRYNTAGK
jgi:hypothetical protein